MAYYFFDRCSEENWNEIKQISEIHLGLEELVDEDTACGFNTSKRVRFGPTNFKQSNYEVIMFDPKNDYPLGVQTSYGCRGNKRPLLRDITLIHRLKDICGAQEIVDGFKRKYGENEFDRLDQRTKREIIRCMSDIAENIYTLAKENGGIVLWDFGVPKAIHVGLGEKKIFKDIVEIQEKEIVNEIAILMPGHALSPMGIFYVASNCLFRDYFPKYGEYRKIEDVLERNGETQKC